MTLSHVEGDYSLDCKDFVFLNKSNAAVREGKVRRGSGTNKTPNKTRHRIENAFAKLKDRGHIAMRYHRCPKIFLGVIVLAAIVEFCL